MVLRYTNLHFLAAMFSMFCKIQYIDILGRFCGGHRNLFQHHSKINLAWYEFEGRLTAPLGSNAITMQPKE